MKQEPAIVQEARAAEICLGCMADKPKGTVLCWNCYKYRTDITPFKDFHGSLEEWLDYVGADTTKLVHRGTV